MGSWLLAGCAFGRRRAERGGGGRSSIFWEAADGAACPGRFDQRPTPPEDWGVGIMGLSERIEQGFHSLFKLPAGTWLACGCWLSNRVRRSIVRSSSLPKTADSNGQSKKVVRSIGAHANRFFRFVCFTVPDDVKVGPRKVSHVRDQHLKRTQFATLLSFCSAFNLRLEELRRTGFAGGAGAQQDGRLG